MVGWWLVVGWRAGWLTGCLLAGWMADWLLDLPTLGWLVGCFAGVSRLASWRSIVDGWLGCLAGLAIWMVGCLVAVWRVGLFACCFAASLAGAGLAQG